MSSLKLFMVHCGYYDQVGHGSYESHTNLFLPAESAEKAKDAAKSKSIFKEKRMHVDSVFAIEDVEGYQVNLVKM